MDSRTTIDFKVGKFTVKLFKELLYGQALEIENLLFKGKSINLSGVTNDMEIDAGVLMQQQEITMMFLIKEVINAENNNVIATTTEEKKAFVFNLTRVQGLSLKNKTDELIAKSNEAITTTKKKS